MKVRGLIGRLTTALFLLAGSAACMAEVTELQQDELMRRIKADRAGLILDVRSPEEYAEGHIPGAINIPHDRLSSRLAEVGSHKDREIVLYCRSGRRVGVAANILQAAGFSKLLHLAGDMSGWLDKGNLPISK